MKKFWGLFAVAFAVLALFASSVGAQTPSSANPGAVRPAKTPATSLRELDDTLARRVQEQLEFITLLERHLKQSRGVADERSVGDVVLSRRAPPPAAPVTASPAPRQQPAPRVEPAAVAAPEDPWWTRLRLQMVMRSGAAAQAVINDQLVSAGQALADGVTLVEIGEQDVLVRRADRSVRLSLDAR